MWKKNKFYFLLFILVLIPNLITAGLIELSFDEAYYWMYSRHLDWGYFDHPPLIAPVIAFGTSIFGTNEFGVRFGGNVLLGISLVVMWNMVGRKNLLAFMLLFFSMPLLNYSGIFALPDTVLLSSVVFYFWSLKRYLDKVGWPSILMLALSISFLFYAKYHGLLIVLLTICANLKFLKQKTFWYVAGLSLFFYLPHLWWQYQHDFISFKFHLFGRVEKHFSAFNLLDYTAGQFFLMGATNLILIIRIFRKTGWQNLFEKILAFNSFGFLAVLFLVAFRNQIEANWTVSCAIAFILLVTARMNYSPKVLWAYSSLSIALVVTLRIALHMAEPISYLNWQGDENRFNEIARWKNERIPKIKKLCGSKRIVSENYQYAAKLGFYLNQDIPAIHLKSRKSQYSLWNFENNIGPLENICFLTTKNLKHSIKIETNFKDPVYILPSTNLTFLAMRYNTSYEEIVRN